MLSVIDVIKSLTLLIETNFSDYPVNDRDLNEGFDRPSYFIDVDDVDASNVTSHYVRETANLSVYFFAEDIYKGFLNLLQVKKTLLELLNKPLKLMVDEKVVAHVVFNDVNVTVNKADKALIATMSYELVQERQIDTGDYLIEHIDIDVNIN